jgi:hypothetical protein
VDATAEAEKLDQLLAKFPRLSAENQQYIAGLIHGLKHAQKIGAGEGPNKGETSPGETARP